MCQLWPTRCGGGRYIGVHHCKSQLLVVCVRVQQQTKRIEAPHQSPPQEQLAGGNRDQAGGTTRARTLPRGLPSPSKESSTNPKLRKYFTSRDQTNTPPYQNLQGSLEFYYPVSASGTLIRSERERAGEGDK